MFRSVQSIRNFSSTSARNAFAKMQLMGTVGNVTARETKSGVPLISYSLAVNRFSPNEENQRSTDWFNISVFNERHISFFNDYLKPGMQLYVECDVKQKQLTDESGENKRYVTNLNQTYYDVIRFAKKQDAEEE